MRSFTLKKEQHRYVQEQMSSIEQDQEGFLNLRKKLSKSGFADDINSTWKLVNLVPWWTKLNDDEGPEIGYYPEASTSWLLAKTVNKADTKVCFSN